MKVNILTIDMHPMAN
uniref:Uncharacterized protein n=1 Tax=Anguilla anguilla TaxID=7936 RepID=A0A0E9T7V8_ANGAN